MLVRLSLLVVAFIKARGDPLVPRPRRRRSTTCRWGTMLAEAQSELILGYWWQLVAATAFMAVFVTAFSLHDRRAARRARPEAAGPGMSAPAGGNLLSIGDLQVAFRLGKEATARRRACVRGVRFDVAENSTVAPGRRVGLGQERHARCRSLNLLPDNAERQRTILGTQGRDMLRPRCRDASCSGCAARRSPAVFQDPMSSLNPVFTVGQQIAEPLMQAPGPARAGGRWARAEALLNEVGMPGAEAAARRLSARAVGRPAAAGDDRDGARLRAQAADRRRADDRPRRDDPAPDPRAARRGCRRSTAMSMLFISHDLGAGRRDRRSRGRDAQRRRARAGPGGANLRRAAGRLHRGRCSPAGPTAGRQSARADGDRRPHRRRAPSADTATASEGPGRAGARSQARALAKSFWLRSGVFGESEFARGAGRHLSTLRAATRSAWSASRARARRRSG